MVVSGSLVLRLQSTMQARAFVGHAYLIFTLYSKFFVPVWSAIVFVWRLRIPPLTGAARPRCVLFAAISHVPKPGKSLAGKRITVLPPLLRIGSVTPYSSFAVRVSTEIMTNSTCAEFIAGVARSTVVVSGAL